MMKENYIGKSRFKATLLVVIALFSFVNSNAQYSSKDSLLLDFERITAFIEHESSAYKAQANKEYKAANEFMVKAIKTRYALTDKQVNAIVFEQLTNYLGSVEEKQEVEYFKDYELAIGARNFEGAIKCQHLMDMMKYHYRGEKQDNEVIKKLESILALHEGDKKRTFEEHFFLGEFYEVRSQPNEALRHYNIALKAMSDSEAKRRSDFLSKQLEDRKTSITDQKEKRIYRSIVLIADQYFAKKNWVKAQLFYKEAMEAAPNETYPKQKLKEVEAIMDIEDQK